MTVEELLEQLYNLDRTDLRRVAWEALLMSDGPDKVSNEPVRNEIQVSVGTRETIGVFMIYADWTA